MQVHVTNNIDNNIDILLTPLTTPELLDQHKCTADLAPGKTNSYYVNTGTMRLSIRDQHGSLLWRGPVPTFIKDPLIFSNGEVTYQGVPIPQPVRRSRWTLWVILGLIILTICIYWLWLRLKR